jgi:bifunctional enzyme CysN/CysC
VRALHEADGVPFFEVWVSTLPEECARRDPKGLWARARRGELSGLTGVDAPYEAPERPELELSGDVAVAEAKDLVVALL